MHPSSNFQQIFSYIVLIGLHVELGRFNRLSHMLLKNV